MPIQTPVTHQPGLGSATRLPGYNQNLPTSDYIRNSRHGRGSQPGTTKPIRGNSGPGSLADGMARHRQNFGKGTSQPTNAGRGTNQAARNINNFGSNNQNVANNPGTSIKNTNHPSVRDLRNRGIQSRNGRLARQSALNRAANRGPRGNLGRLKSRQLAQQRLRNLQSKGANTQLGGSGINNAGKVGSAATIGVSAAPGSLGATKVGAVGLGTKVGLGGAALGVGLLIGNAIYEGVGRPFGPSLGDYARRWINGHSDGELSQYKQATPFKGGQSLGVLYLFETQAFDRGQGGIKRTRNAIGPLGIRYNYTAYADGSKSVAGYYTHGAGSQIVSTSSAPDTYSLVISNVRRADGQPDTGGDPDPVIPGYPGLPGPPDLSPNPDPDPDPDSEPEPEPTPQKTPRETPATKPLTPTEPEKAPQEETENQPEDINRPVPPLFVPAKTKRPPSKTRLNNSSGGGGTPPQPPIRRRRRCSCNRGINAHADQIGQQLNDRFDQITGNANDAAQNGLLGLILGFVEQIASVTGVGAFPITAPVNLNKKAAGSTTLNNIAEAHVWQAKNLDSTIGGWPNTISNLSDGSEIENLTVSDSLAEIQGLLMAMAIGQGINQQGIFKTLTETTTIKQQSLLGRQYAQANAEYLGYSLQQTSTNVPNTYTPGVDSITDLLNPTSIPMETVRNNGDRDIQSDLRELLFAAAVIRAAFFRNTGTDDIENSIRQRVAQANNINANDGDSFAEYLREVEQGFGLTNPYGRDQTNGPKITDRSTDNGQS